MIKHLFNLIKNKNHTEPQPKLTTEPTSPFYKWTIDKLKTYSDIQWKYLLEYGVVQKVEHSTAYIYYNTPPEYWANLAGCEANVKVCLIKREIIEFELLEMN